MIYFLYICDVEYKERMEMTIDDNKLRLPSGRIITFNEQQYDAIKLIREWLDNSNGLENIFILSGFAGTGKTTVVKKILDEYKGNNVCVSAPTHKAKKVIMNTTDVEGLTLHGLLGLRPDINLDEFNPNRPIFNPIALPKICHYSLVIIDECSMINSGLLELIIKQTRGMYTRILFMGDPAQIPPVNEADSVIFDLDVKYKASLTKLERQNDGNPLLDIYDSIRNGLDLPYRQYNAKTVLNSINEGAIFLDDNNIFKEKMFKTFKSKDFEGDTDYCKVLAWTNKAVEYTNKVIRDSLYGNTSNIIEMGDVVMGYRSVQGNKFSNLIDNSADYKVVKKGDLVNNKYGINGYYVSLRENLSENTYAFKNVFIVDVKDYDNLHNYAEEHDRLLIKAKNNKKLWNAYYTFRKNNILMCNITTFRNNKNRNIDEIIVKDLDYGYCVTVHKSQGSTYNTVFILDDDINKNYKIVERNKIKYVAFTRPKQNAIIFNKPNK